MSHNKQAMTAHPAIIFVSLDICAVHSGIADWIHICMNGFEKLPFPVKNEKLCCSVDYLFFAQFPLEYNV